MEEEKELLPHQEAAILLEFARDGKLSYDILYTRNFFRLIGDHVIDLLF